MKNKQPDLSSLDYLETPLPDKSEAAADISLLQTAAAYHINLDDLERIMPEAGGDNDNLPVAAEPVETPSAPPRKEEPAREETSFNEIMLPFSELVEKVFRRSSHPVVVISEDKIVYSNVSFLKLVDADSEESVYNTDFLQYVSSEYWNAVAEGIGDILTDNKSMIIGMKRPQGKVRKISFDAIYIPDDKTFSFILIGESLRPKGGIITGLYDEETGLPNYYLMEDRLQVVVNNANNKGISFGKNIIALLCINLDNFDTFVRVGNTEIIFKRVISRISMVLNKSYTFARGLQPQHFWILIPNIADYDTLATECTRLKSLFDEPVTDNFTDYRLITSFGVSMFPEPATSAKKLIEHADLAVKKAVKDGGNRIVYFGY